MLYINLYQIKYVCFVSKNSNVLILNFVHSHVSGLIYIYILFIIFILVYSIL
jgi:hypothetical protein